MPLASSSAILREAALMPVGLYLDAGDTRDELAARVKAAFNDLDDDRARMIAQTETAAAHGYGRHVALVTAGIERKKWVTSQNQNVRAAHRYPRALRRGDLPFPFQKPLRLDLGDKGVWYRVQGGPLDEKQAQSVCNTLKTRNGTRSHGSSSGHQR